MPLICDPAHLPKPTSLEAKSTNRRQSQQSDIAKLVMMSNVSTSTNNNSSNSNSSSASASNSNDDQTRHTADQGGDHVAVKDLKDTLGQALQKEQSQQQRDPPRDMHPPARPLHTHAATLTHIPQLSYGSASSTQANNDTPVVTAPNSPRLLPVRQNSGTSTPRVRPTTLDIPGLTKSKVSPDGRIAKRDVGAKLVIVMVGLPARGKSYITKKLARYLNWLQHDTRIFNVGERRRVAGRGPNTLEKTTSQEQRASISKSISHRQSTVDHRHSLGPSGLAQNVINNDPEDEGPQHTTDRRGSIIPDALGGNATKGLSNVTEESEVDNETAIEDMPELTKVSTPDALIDSGNDSMDQSASFFDPSNKKAALIREQCAMDTLDELLEYILEGDGSVGILDATNSTLERRRIIMKRIREKAGAELNVLFLESRCVDETLLESNMRLKLSGPDYKDKDPAKSLEDFKKRVAIYEKNYVPLGDHEEKENMPYIQMIDVGRKIISHQIRGFLSAQANYYLLNFNLAPRQIWITRHGLSMDNVSGKIGGDSDLSHEGEMYAKSLTKFVGHQRNEWDFKQLHKIQNSHFPPQPGDTTPPNPHYQPNANNELQQKSFCVWTSMLKRSIDTAQFFDEEEFDIKQMRMLDELNAGIMEGHTYSSIAEEYPDEYSLRKKDKLHYRYPGPGGEGYLDIINRLRPVIVELERMTDHVLLVGHRSVARVLLAYFRGLGREEVADLDVPIGMLYCLEPKPYGVDFKAYKWDRKTQWFYEQQDFELKRAEDDMQ